MTRWFSISILVFLTACIPIPVMRRALVQPELEISVIDRETKKPIGNADIRSIRYSNPYLQMNRLFLQKTDSQGITHFQKHSEREWIFPLMMHGIPEHHFAVIAWAKGYRAERIGADASDCAKMRFALCRMKTSSEPSGDIVNMNIHTYKDDENCPSAAP